MRCASEVITVSLTVPEGLTFSQIARLVESRGLAAPGEFRKALEELDAAGEIPFIPTDRSRLIEPYEGVLFPETYTFEETAGPKAYCQCGWSEKLPYCDGSHSRKGTSIRPIVVEVTEVGRKSVCQCHQCKTPPWCDGTHKTIPPA